MTTSSSSSSKTTYLLTGDIGGTNSRMSLYQLDKETPIVTKTYRNATSIEGDPNNPSTFGKSVVEPFLQHCKDSIDLANSQILGCLATAGIVADNQVRMTNLGNLLVDGNYLAACQDGLLGMIYHCKIINDFVAQGYGCLTLTRDQVQHLDGPDTLSRTHSPKVCIGAGTGLGECYLTPSSSGTYTCFPSEGGHAELAPLNALQVELWEYLIQKFCGRGRVSYERVVSGIGLANVYEFLCTKYPEKVNKSLHEEFLAAADQKGRVVGTHVETDELCKLSMEVFLSAYGSATGTAAITWLPTSGIFLTGGLTPKNLKYITAKDSPFLKSYRHKGRVSKILDDIPLYAVLAEDLGVRGAHRAAVMEYEAMTSKKRDAVTTTSTNPTTSLTLLVAAAAIVSFGVGLFLGKNNQQRGGR